MIHDLREIHAVADANDWPDTTTGHLYKLIALLTLEVIELRQALFPLEDRPQQPAAGQGESA